MNKLALIFENTWTEALGWTLLHSLWLGALLCLLWRISLLGKRSPEWRYLSSLVTLGSLFVLIIITFGWELSQLNALQNIEIELDATQLSTSPNPVNTNLELTEQNNLLTNLSAWIKPYFPWLSLAWLGGIFILSLRLIGGWLYLEYLRRSGQHIVPLQWQEQVEQLSLKLNIKRHVRLLESNLLDHPITMGFLKPIILFPIGMISQMSPEQIEAILLHELAHIKRADYLVNYFQSIVEIVLFYHPAVWWISQDLRESREHCCDDLALRQGYDRWQYAQALLQLTKTNISSKTIFAMSLTGNKHSQLSRRIQRLFGRYTPERFMSRGLLMAILLSGSLMTWAFHSAPVPTNADTNETVDQTLGEKFLFKITQNSSIQEIDKFNVIMRKYGYELETVVRDEALKIQTVIIAKTTPDGYPITISEFKSVSTYATGGTSDPLNFHADGVISVAWDEDEVVTGSTIAEPTPVEPIIVEGRNVIEAQNIKIDSFKIVEENTNEPATVTVRGSLRKESEPLYVINGELFDTGSQSEVQELIDEIIQTNEVERINILKGEAAVETYGPAAIVGVVEIELKNSDQESPLVLKGKLYQADPLQEVELVMGQQAASLFEGESQLSPLIILNGKPLSAYPISKNTLFVEMDDQVPSLLPAIADDVQTINVYKSEKATHLFGEDARGGVIEITMKDRAVNDLLARQQPLQQSVDLQIFPNPANDQLSLSFELPRATETKVWVTDMSGREVLGVFNLPLAQGPHEIEFDTKQLSSGTYIVNLQYDNHLMQRKLIIK
ncbi:MAG: M56 family metallopeptidase [Bacteroidia bacterium]